MPTDTPGKKVSIVPFTCTKETAYIFHEIHLPVNRGSRATERMTYAQLTEGYEVRVNKPETWERVIMIVRRVGTERTEQLSLRAPRISAAKPRLLLDLHNRKSTAARSIVSRLKYLLKDRPSYATLDDWIVQWPHSDWLHDGWFIPKQGPLRFLYGPGYAERSNLPSGVYTSMSEYEVVELYDTNGDFHV